ncbi:FAD-dependent oxidoreductase [Pseudomonas sp. SWRI99]|uniref:FAD-dependent oxidoreductase n=1 Tax=Pseudomonas sp. SWRI99 TaxID=2745506 RepID=UPI001647A3F7|nr:NAD(P)/FAD-dependent oxidoreductase [Pseudomonas sp. SWRI99]
MTRFDVVVVGAGPAGCACAISCAQRGLRVALVERRPFPRFRPGESLHPGIEPLLQQLGVAGQLCSPAAMRFDGHWIHWDGPPRFSPFGADENGPWRGFQIARADLDGALLQQARRLGVHVRQPCRASKVLTLDARVTGLETDSGCLHATWLIDASGATGWLGRQLALPDQAGSPPLQVRYGYLHGCLDPYANTPHLLAVPYGWTWIAQVQTQLLHWTNLAFATDRAQNADRQMLPEALRVLPQAGPTRGADVGWRISKAAAGNGYFLVGDCASRLDPAASHGVLKALMSGMQAAQAVHDCLRRPILEAVVQAQYRQWLHAWFERDATQLRHFYRQHPYPPQWLGCPAKPS